MKRASYKPSATSLGAGTGTGVLMAVLALVATKTNMSASDLALWSIIIGGLGATASAFVTPDADVSLGRRSRDAALAFLTYSGEDAVKIDPANNTDGFGGEPPMVDGLPTEPPTGANP